MTATSNRAFDQDLGLAGQAAEDGPVVITNGGRPAFVLMTVAEYERLRKPKRSIAEALAMPEGGDLDYDFPRVAFSARTVDLD